MKTKEELKKEFESKFYHLDDEPKKVYSMYSIADIWEWVEDEIILPKSESVQSLDGLSLIIEEINKVRSRGWTSEHDYKENGEGQLINGALFALTLKEEYMQGWDFENKLVFGEDEQSTDFDLRLYKSLIRRYTVAGQFIASELTRLIKEAESKIST